MSFAVVSHAHRNIFAVNGHPQGARYGGDPHQRSGRDLRLDLFRGLSLIFIFVDHVPDNVLSYLTLQSFSFCDAAEVFIFISGYAAAIVYGKALQRRGSVIATAQIYRRVWQLYVAHIFLFVIFAALVFYATLNVQHQDYNVTKTSASIILSMNPISRSSRRCCCSINLSTSISCRST